MEKIKWRKGDVVVNCPPKSGTHWGMFLTHLIRNQLDTSFDCLYDVVPWLEFRYFKEQTQDEITNGFEKLPSPRTFKSHMPTPPFPCMLNFMMKKL